MSSETAAIRRKLVILQVLTWMMLVGAPVNFLYIGSLLVGKWGPLVESDIAVYVLFALALVYPAYAPIHERATLTNYRHNSGKSLMHPKVLTFLSGIMGKKKTATSLVQPIDMFLKNNVVKLALVSMAYAFGLLAAFLTGEFDNMLYFYPIGIVWSIIYWPRRKKYERLLEKLSVPLAEPGKEKIN